MAAGSTPFVVSTSLSRVPRFLGRPAAADRDRPRARPRAGPRSLRRAGLGPRRLYPGPGPES